MNASQNHSLQAFLAMMAMDAEADVKVSRAVATAALPTPKSGALPPSKTAAGPVPGGRYPEGFFCAAESPRR
jgi:hypothetical protein